MPDPAATPLYAASVAGVRRLLPDVVIDDDSRPSAADVGEWLLEYEDTVAARIGLLTALEPAVAAPYLRRARNLVHLAAGATTEDAVHPSGASTTESSYGKVLWDRYTQGLELLEVDAEEARSETPGASAGGDPAGAYPPPAIPDNVRW